MFKDAGAAAAVGAIQDLPRDAFWKTGSGGHALYVVPSLNLVVWKLGGRDGQYSTDDTGLKPSPASPQQIAEWAAWKESVDAGTAAHRTLAMVIGAMEGR
jgi:CubicO group peptidase (beta-lactamase class C family)